MSEDTHRTVEAVNAPDVDERIIDWIREALHRLRNRGYKREDSITIEVGNEVWYELHGEYFEVESDARLSIEGNVVLRNMRLPDYRVILIDDDAMTEIKYETGPSAFNDEDAYPQEPTVVSGKRVRASEAIEFVPETEVHLGND